MIYAASKRALQTWFEGLRHACAGTPVRVRFYVLGYLDTNLAFGRRTLLPRADPARLAARVVREPGRARGGRVLSSRVAARRARSCRSSRSSSTSA